MKALLLSLSLSLIHLTYSQSAVGSINDPDGYVNIRLAESSKSEILGRINESEHFNYFRTDASNWWPVETASGIIGFVHKSRIKHVQTGYLQQGRIETYQTTIDIKRYQQNDVSIEIIQLKPTTPNPQFSCKGLLRSIKDLKRLHEITYDSMDPVGSNYGLIYLDYLEDSELHIVGKYGDYQGEQLIIDASGAITKFNGGTYFITSDHQYLIASWNSDLSGLSIYDLKLKKLLYEKELEEHFGYWYNDNGTYYASLWENGEETNKTYVLNFENLSLIKSTFSIDKRKRVNQVYKDCYCGEPK